MKKIVLLLLFLPVITYPQQYAFDGTWEGTYFSPSEQGRTTLEVFYYISNDEYACSLHTKSETSQVKCFNSGITLTVIDYEGILFMLIAHEFTLSTRWTEPQNKHHFHPEPIIECYYEESIN